MRRRAESTSGLIRRSEWSRGTNPSGVKPNNNVACRSVSPGFAVCLSYNNTRTSMISHAIFQQPLRPTCGLLKRVGCGSDCVRQETVASLFAPTGSVIEVRLRA